MAMALTNSFSALISLLLLFSLYDQLVLSSASDGGYGSKPYSNEKPNLEKDNILSTNSIAIQGIVYCKAGPKPIPLEGAVVRITCEAVDEYGFETAPFTFLNDATDEKGYFFSTLCRSEIAEKRELKECKAFLELSPSETCNVPTNVNKGITGSLLSSYRLINDNNIKLFTVGPLFFTIQTNSVYNGY
ncbi:Pollen Ole e 1 allergen and extensin family protein [Parasponia andersonii]|uniref:Pollen Ole e 1 allergen and extensin family protein n=1 Tax=Parasponia andersonii TaxID=3476 RepID=A0A2P5CXR7_PARAD|nr:Pollen Ole e 1 allergen and extensin family protein [Parasponia andersonii]